MMLSQPEMLCTTVTGSQHSISARARTAGANAKPEQLLRDLMLRSRDEAKNQKMTNQEQKYTYDVNFRSPSLCYTPLGRSG